MSLTDDQVNELRQALAGAANTKKMPLGTPVYTPMRNTLNRLSPVSSSVPRVFIGPYSDGPETCLLCGGAPSRGQVVAGCLDAHISDAWLCGRCINLFENPVGVQWMCSSCLQPMEEWRILK